jgi:hypothetical protein
VLEIFAADAYRIHVRPDAGSLPVLGARRPVRASMPAGWHSGRTIASNRSCTRLSANRTARSRQTADGWQMSPTTRGGQRSWCARSRRERRALAVFAGGAFNRYGVPTPGSPVFSFQRFTWPRGFSGVQRAISSPHSSPHRCCVSQSFDRRAWLLRTVHRYYEETFGPVALMVAAVAVLLGSAAWEPRAWASRNHPTPS